MENQLFYKFFKLSPTAYSFQKIIYNNAGIPCDYEITHVNQAYEELMQIKAIDIIGKKNSELYDNSIETDVSQWYMAYQKACNNNKSADADFSFDSGQKWLRIKLIPIQNDYFAFIYLQVTKEYLQGQEIEAFLHVNLDMLCVLDKEGNFIKVNKEFNHVLSYDIGEFEGKSLFEFIHEEDVVQTKDIILKLKDNESVIGTINRHRCKDGSYRYLEWHYQIRGQFLYASARDITERKKIEHELRKSEEKYRLMTENTSDVIWVFNTTSNKHTFISPSVEQLRGFNVEEALQQSIKETIDPNSVKMIEQIIKDRVFDFITNLDTQKNYITEVKRICKNGDLVWTEDTTRYRFNDKNEVEIVGVSRNIEKRKHNEKEILFLSYHDQLTGIFNRYYMERKINEEMKKSDRYNEPLSMAILDLDHFKNVNDTWGHPVGDDVLKWIAELMESQIRDSDTLARMGGEEFGIVMSETDVEGATIVSEKIRKAIENAIHPIIGKITVSIGVGERMKSESYIKWYKRVDAALYCAKGGGRNLVVRSDQIEQLPITSVEVKWKQEWESGNQVIDNQHKELLNLGNRLIEMSFAGDSVEKIMEQLGLLFDHIKNHFEYEEGVQRELKYPGYELHCKSHNKLIHKAQNLEQQFIKGELKSSAFFSFLVDDVIMGHLVDEDVKYFPYTNIKKI